MATTEPVETLRDQLRRACAEADGFRFEGLKPHDYQKHVDGILAVLLAESGEKYRAQAEVIDAERRAMDPEERLRREAADAPYLRIQMAFLYERAKRAEELSEAAMLVLTKAASCGESSDSIGGFDPIGPCILRPHEGPVHMAADGAKWWRTDEPHPG